MEILPIRCTSECDLTTPLLHFFWHSSSLSLRLERMHAPKSPLRKGAPYAGSNRSSFVPNRANVPDVNPILIIVGQIRTAADNYNTSLAHVEDLSRALAKLSTFYLAAKFSEAVSTI